MVDSVDKFGVWYRSTVQLIRENEEGVSEALIGYRVYDEENGNREDLKGKFIGWGSTYDIWIPVASPKIQRIDTVSHFYKLTGNKNMVYDDINVNDVSDILVNSKSIKKWSVARIGHYWENHLASDAFNEFGEQGGFDTILRLISSGSNLSVSHLCSLMIMLFRTMPSWHR